ncbi:DUF4062 domain-containing protein [uncultured Eubacterium sp.]|uniref:DUF4062 domain-containing protein n=1 Tax=uncultured Eubacterium sp. TaxID=165185 RepID=UPI00267327B6|nr:DUF4062 domain-containing protein [uncultured Eubacterium sp.]
MNTDRHTPVVFVSSTCYDLKQVREDLKEFFETNYGFQTMLSEFDSFPIDPCIGTFENCLSNVDKSADIFILIVGTRYGYVTESGKSITNLEYLHAKAKGIPVFVFVDKQLYSQLKIWEVNKDGNFSTVVDNPQLFEFVSEIYSESKQWIYTYESVRDITTTMRHQLSLIFSDGLRYKKISHTLEPHILDSNISAEALRVLIEKPYAWEYKFLAYVMKDEFDKLQKHRWDFKYGLFATHIIEMSPDELLENVSVKLNEIVKLNGILCTLLNSAIQDAIGEAGVPSDLEMIVYVSKQFASLYERIVAWALYFKTIHTNEVFKQLLKLLYELPKSLLTQMDNFVNRLYVEIANLPDIEDDVRREIKLSCVLDEANTRAINEEIERLHELLC